MGQGMESVLITGTSSGIGAATADLFIQKGYDVIGIDRKPPILDHRHFQHYTADIRDKHQLPLIGGLSYLILNAGVLYREEDPIGVNLYGTFNCEDIYIKGNLDSLRAVVILSSTAAHDGQDCREYVASKGGLLSYTRHLAQLLAVYGIRVNSLSPGAGETPMNRGFMDDETYKAVAEANMMKRWNQPEECAKYVYFMAVDATFTTGADLLIDGGEMIRTRYVWGKHEVPDYPQDVPQQKFS